MNIKEKLEGLKRYDKSVEHDSPVLHEYEHGELVYWDDLEEVIKLINPEQWILDQAIKQALGKFKQEVSDGMECWSYPDNITGDTFCFVERAYSNNSLESALFYLKTNSNPFFEFPGIAKAFWPGTVPIPGRLLGEQALMPAWKFHMDHMEDLSYSERIKYLEQFLDN